MEKGESLLCSGNEVKYSFIHHKKIWPVGVLCQLLGVTRQSYYSYQKRQNNKPKDPLHDELIERIKKIAESRHYCYGSRRMRKALNVLGYPVGRR
ncbi:transposase [Legionella sainthelensi]|uniref:HTH-like domain-containing protein n=1 Tax=Legionella sainthelensi TaxID=28087 RepID=A0A2H5FM29_9GAMM|nr:transposase [Legionella sainthelensi]